MSLNAFSAASVPAAKQVVETGGVSFAEVAQERGLLHVWPQQPRPMRSPEAFGCGCAAFDYDNDGWQDVLLVADPHARLYHNLGGSRFEEVTESVGLLSAQADWVTAAGLPASLRDWIGAAVGDYDGDGWLDLLLTGFHRLALFKNDGGKGFIDVTTQAGLDPANHEHWGAS
ncbi:MAG TPA: VCBS repeat-containing protein, partial [Pirellulales bacterium]|nr:VCBS repeat-containing protein [Pirellulales bacterium]